MQPERSKSELVIAQALRVRELQKSYFKTRNLKVFQEARQQEKKLDIMLLDYFSKQERLL